METKNNMENNRPENRTGQKKQQGGYPDRKHRRPRIGAYGNNAPKKPDSWSPFPKDYSHDTTEPASVGHDMFGGFPAMLDDMNVNQDYDGGVSSCVDSSVDCHGGNDCGGQDGMLTYGDMVFRRYREWTDITSVAELPGETASTILVLLEKRTKNKQRVVTLSPYAPDEKKRGITGYDSKHRRIIGYYVIDESDFVRTTSLDTSEAYNGFTAVVRISTQNGEILKEGLVINGRIAMEGIPVGTMVGYYVGPHIRFAWDKEKREWYNFAM